LRAYLQLLQVCTVTGHQDRVYAVAFSHDGKRMASGSGDKTVKVWDTVTGNNVRSHYDRVSRTGNLQWLTACLLLARFFLISLYFRVPMGRFAR